VIKTTQHGEHLWQVTRQGWCNCYLVAEPDGLTLIDTNFIGASGAIRDAAQALGMPIVRICLTHAHSDHAGSLDKLVAGLPEAEVCFGAREARFMRGDRALLDGEPKKMLKAMVKLRTRPSRELLPGDRIGSLEVFAAPGHTPGQIAFLDTRDRSLIAGDSFTSIAGLYVTSQINPRFPFPTLATWDRPTALASAVALTSLKPSRLALGHGRVVEPAAAAMVSATARG